MALDVLAAHLATFEPGPDGLVFTDDRGQAIRRPHIGHLWRKAARRAGVEGRSFHDLRHLCASVLIARGASVKSVQRFVGHASAKVTLDTYAHLWPDDEDRTRAALDDVLGPAVSPACHLDGAGQRTRGGPRRPVGLELSGPISRNRLASGYADKKMRSDLRRRPLRLDLLGDS